MWLIELTTCNATIPFQCWFESWLPVQLPAQVPGKVVGGCPGTWVPPSTLRLKSSILLSVARSALTLVAIWRIIDQMEDLCVCVTAFQKVNNHLRKLSIIRTSLSRYCYKVVTGNPKREQQTWSSCCCLQKISKTMSAWSIDFDLFLFK